MSAEVRRLHSGCVDFSPLTRQFTLPILGVDLPHLLDLELAIYVEPALHPLVRDQQLIGSEDVRLYINGKDVTQSLKNELASAIRAVPAELVKARYLEGVTRYLDFTAAIDGSTTVRDGDESVAEAYADTDDWGGKFSTLGDRTVGWSGNLHVLSFIYKCIPMQAISLGTVWKDYIDRSGEALPETLAELGTLTLTISQGAAPMYGSIDPGFFPGGRLHYQVELVHRNPLEPRLRQIAARLRRLSEQLDTLRVEYLDRLVNDVQVLKGDLVAHTQATQDAIDQLTQTVENIASGE